ncbi:MAG: TonB-dependent receptor [Bacteroidia bacterium]|nr:TonB-dependent receptor [Bacteroidia bacterium]
MLGLPSQKSCLIFYLLLLSPLLAFVQNGVVKGWVKDDFGVLPGAELAIEGTKFTINADLQGNFRWELPPGQYNLIAGFPLYKSQTQSVKIEAGKEVEANFTLELKTSSPIEVTVGSRAHPRSLMETAVPVDVISPEDITQSTQLELGQILEYISPSFYSVPQTIADGTDHSDPATLRGLGPDQLLVLINGKRRHTSSLINVNGTVGKGSVGTDLNAIPVSAIDRIEILRDGAAAQYGSDAIAGVINIILKDEIDQGNIAFSSALNSAGDGLETVVSGNYGFAVGNSGFLSLTAEFRDRGATNRAGDYTGNVYSLNDSLDAQLIADSNFFGQTGFQNKQIMEIGNAATRNSAVFMNGVIPINDQAEFYAHGGFNFRIGEAHGFYRLPIDRTKVVPEIYPNGFSPLLHTDILDQSMCAGVRGKSGNWNLDFSNTFGSNRFSTAVKNSNNASMGTASPTNFSTGGFAYRQNNTNFGVSRTFDWLQSVNLAFGGLLRVENYQIFSGEESSWKDYGDTAIVGGDTLNKEAGAQMFPGLQPENELNKFRTNTASYIDLEANITQKLMVGAAARYELYSDFGNNLTYKIVSRYRLNKYFSLRGGYSTGLRAPSLAQVYFNNIGVQFIDGNALSVGTFNNQSAVTRAFGIGPLKPELSRHLSGGFTTELAEGFSFTLDGYLILIQDRIVLSGRLAEGFDSILDPLNTGAAQFFTNAINTRTQGLDAVITWRRQLKDGHFKISLAGNLTQTRLKGDIQVNSTENIPDSVLFNREEVSRIEVAQPNFKVIGIASYKTGKLSFRLQSTLFGRVKYIHPDDANPASWVLNQYTGQLESRDQVFRPKLLTDLSLNYQIFKNLTWTLGCNNLFNVYPDPQKHSANVDEGRFVYSRRVQQFGVKGAQFLVRLNLSI